MERPPLNPFLPGRGALPPYLAGREAEKRELMGILAYVRAGRGAPRDVVVCGPRGNGKTALLRWFENEVAALGERIDLLWRTPTDIPNLDALATTLVPPGRFKSMLPDSLQLSIGVGRVGWELGDNPHTLTELLILRCRQRPLVVVLDEAHTLDLVVGQALPNASQSVSGRAPFLLVLAGTPGLEPQLNAMSATFWDRAEQLVVDLLAPEAAAEALTRPFESGAPAAGFEAEALERVLESSQCYPYFLQLLGAALWDVAASSGRTLIDGSTVTEASPAFERKRGTYYYRRRNELDRAGLLGTASSLADLFIGRDAVTQAEVDAAIAENPAETIRVRDELAAVGYIWNPPGRGDVWRPGIPSLMSYIESIASPG